MTKELITITKDMLTVNKLRESTSFRPDANNPKVE